MKILHFADLHLGVESYGRPDPATGLSSRLGDFLRALDEVVDYALDSGVDLVLFCGDAYRSRNPSQTHQREFARRIGRLAASGIPIFLLVGNHDLPNAIGRATSVEIFDTLAVRNIFVASRPGTYRIETKGGVIQVMALPWVRRNALLAREDTKNLTFDQLNDRLQQILTDWLANETEALDPSLPTVLAAHVSISTARPGSEKTMVVGQDYVLLQSNVAKPAFDYIALGHIHKHQVLSENPPMVYSGSLERIDFGDEDEEKGFYIIELDGARSRGERVASYSFQPVTARRFLTIEVNADTDDPTSTVLRAIAKKGVKDAIVRLEIKVSASREGLVQEAEIRKALKDAYFVASIVKDIERERRIRLGGQSAERLTPLEALKLYLESKKTPPDRTKVLLECGERLIARESGALE